MRAFNPKYKEAEGALVGEFQRLQRRHLRQPGFPQHLRNQGKFFCAEENRELDLTLIDYGDLARPREQWRNVYEVTEEFYRSQRPTTARARTWCFSSTASRCW